MHSIIVTLLAGLLQLRGWMYWLAFIYVFAANGFFLVRRRAYPCHGTQR